MRARIIDFETRSVLELGDVGAARYAESPMTEVLCAGYMGECGKPKLWINPKIAVQFMFNIRASHLSLINIFNISRGKPNARYIARKPSPDKYTLLPVKKSNPRPKWKGPLILPIWAKYKPLSSKPKFLTRANSKYEAHNAGFEFNIWNKVCAPRFGWPKTELSDWDDTAARAAVMSLPRGLGDAGVAVGATELKDKEGRLAMLKLCKPKEYKPDGSPVYEHAWDLYLTTFEYCLDDVRAEAALAEKLHELNEEENRIRLQTEAMNERGVRIDTTSVVNALKIVDEYSSHLTGELKTLTQGAVETANQHAKLKEWVSSQGVELPNTQAETIEDYVRNRKDQVPPHVYRVLQIRQALGKSSVAKLYKMEEMLCADGRVRDLLMYHGASTGRESGRGIQLQNLPKGDIKLDYDVFYEELKDRDWRKLEAKYGSVLDSISSGIRGLIIADPGHRLIAVDYAAIEARVLAWQAEQSDLIELFETGGDPYCDMASSIFNRTITKEDKAERQLGKSLILGAGFGLAAKKFVTHVARDGISVSEEQAKKYIQAYRKKNDRIVSYWYDLERAAVEAVVTGKPTMCRKVSFAYDKNYLMAVLPSGRVLYYPEPAMMEKENPWRPGQKRTVLTAMGVDSVSRKYVRYDLYYGILVENLVQACARDLMMAGRLRVEDHGYTPLMTVHDEVVVQAPLGFGSVKEVEDILIELPEWASGLPLKAEGGENTRYWK